MSDTTRSGDIAEMTFALRAKQNGFTVLTPFSGSCVYDLMLDNGKSQFKIQVKATGHERRKDVFKTNIVRGCQRKDSYKKNEVDFFAIYIINIDKFYIIPFEHVNVISLYLHPMKVEHKLNVFLENWSQLQ